MPFPRPRPPPPLLPDCGGDSVRWLEWTLPPRRANAEPGGAMDGDWMPEWLNTKMCHISIATDKDIVREFILFIRGGRRISDDDAFCSTRISCGLSGMTFVRDVDVGN